MSWDQWLIAITGCTSSWMIHDERRDWRLAASLIACIGQIGWFVAAYKAGQWGIFVVDFIYTLGWIRGIKSNWR